MQAQSAVERTSGEASISDDWELDPAEIQFLEKIASGAFGDLYKGLYCGQEVAIKILRDVQEDPQQYQEFLQVWPVAICGLLKHYDKTQSAGIVDLDCKFCLSSVDTKAIS